MTRTILAAFVIAELLGAALGSALGSLAAQPAIASRGCSPVQGDLITDSELMCVEDCLAPAEPEQSGSPMRVAEVN